MTNTEIYTALASLIEDMKAEELSEPDIETLIAEQAIAERANWELIEWPQPADPLI